MYVIYRHRRLLESIAFVCNKLSDGLTHQEICSYLPINDDYEKEFLLFCSDFGMENEWLTKQDNEDRYYLTTSGRKFVSSQFGKIVSLEHLYPQLKYAKVHSSQGQIN
jgi:hypothetical protein